MTHNLLLVLVLVLVAAGGSVFGGAVGGVIGAYVATRVRPELLHEKLDHLVGTLGHLTDRHEILHRLTTRVEQVKTYGKNGPVT